MAWLAQGELYYPYKQSQVDAFGTINAYFNKWLQYPDNQLYVDDIMKWDTKRMSLYVRAILAANIRQQKLESYVQKRFPHIADVLNDKPLKNPIKLRNNPFGVFKQYNAMGVLL